MAEATKHDSEKPRMELLDPRAMRSLAGVLTYGAKKYAPWNWTKGLEFGRLIGAAQRHLLAFQGGEDVDPESGLSHVAHAMCNLMFLESMRTRHPELDDRCGIVPPAPTESADASAEARPRLGPGMFVRVRDHAEGTRQCGQIGEVISDDGDPDTLDSRPYKVRFNNDNKQVELFCSAELDVVRR